MSCHKLVLLFPHEGGAPAPLGDPIICKGGTPGGSSARRKIQPLWRSCCWPPLENSLKSDLAPGDDIAGLQFPPGTDDLIQIWNYDAQLAVNDTVWTKSTISSRRYICRVFKTPPDAQRLRASGWKAWRTHASNISAGAVWTSGHSFTAIAH